MAAVAHTSSSEDGFDGGVESCDEKQLQELLVTIQEQIMVE